MIKDYPNIKVTFPKAIQAWTDEACKQKGGIFEPFTPWSFDEDWIEYNSIELNSSFRVKKLDSPMKTAQSAIEKMRKMIRLKGSTIELEA